MFRKNSTWKKVNHFEKNNLNVDNLWENHKEFLKNNKLVLKTQQRFRSKIHNVFTEEVNKIVLRANNDKGIQLFNSIETDAHVTKKNIK